jgi:transcriptional regulator with XRE-family HTH domain
MEQYTRIKEVMKERNTTATKTAERMGIKSGTLSGMINGNPTIGILAKISEAIGCELKELIK